MVIIPSFCIQSRDLTFLFFVAEEIFAFCDPLVALSTYDSSWLDFDGIHRKCADFLMKMNTKRGKHLSLVHFVEGRDPDNAMLCFMEVCKMLLRANDSAAIVELLHYLDSRQHIISSHLLHAAFESATKECGISSGLLMEYEPYHVVKDTKYF